MTAIRKSILKTLEDLIVEYNIKISHVENDPRNLPSRLLKQEFGVENPHFTNFFSVALKQNDTDGKKQQDSQSYNPVGDIYFWKDYGSEDTLKKNVYFFIYEKYVGVITTVAQKFEKESGLNSNIHIISSSDSSYN